MFFNCDKCGRTLRGIENYENHACADEIGQKKIDDYYET